MPTKCGDYLCILLLDSHVYIQQFLYDTIIEISNSAAEIASNNNKVLIP